MSYVVEVGKTVQKELEALPKTERHKLALALLALEENPRPPQSKPMVGTDHYRMRVGRYRCIYSIDDSQGIVIVHRVGHRKDVYR